jgi:hypothetical protein
VSSHPEFISVLTDLRYEKLILSSSAVNIYRCRTKSDHVSRSRRSKTELARLGAPDDVAWFSPLVAFAFFLSSVFPPSVSSTSIHTIVVLLTMLRFRLRRQQMWDHKVGPRSVLQTIHDRVGPPWCARRRRMVGWRSSRLNYRSPVSAFALFLSSAFFLSVGSASIPRLLFYLCQDNVASLAGHGCSWIDLVFSFHAR